MQPLSLVDSTCVTVIDQSYSTVNNLYNKNYPAGVTYYDIKDYGRAEYLSKNIYFINDEVNNLSKFNVINGNTNSISIPGLMPYIFDINKQTGKICLVQNLYDSIQLTGMRVIVVDTMLNILDSIDVYKKYPDTSGLYPTRVYTKGNMVYIAGFRFSYKHSEIISGNLWDRNSTEALAIYDMSTKIMKRYDMGIVIPSYRGGFTDVIPNGDSILGFSSTYFNEFEWNLTSGYNQSFFTGASNLRIYVPYVPLFLDPDSIIKKKKDRVQTSWDLVLYPNPATNQTNIDIPNDGTVENPGMAYIYSSNGQLVLQQKLEFGKNNFDVSGFIPGIYIVRVSNEVKTQSRKLLKN